MIKIGNAVTDLSRALEQFVGQAFASGATVEQVALALRITVAGVENLALSHIAEAKNKLIQSASAVPPLNGKPRISQ